MQTQWYQALEHFANASQSVNTYDYIDYYIYELNWGKNGTNCITEADSSNTYSLTNYDELYEYIKLNN